MIGMEKSCAWAVLLQCLDAGDMSLFHQTHHGLQPSPIAVKGKDLALVAHHGLGSNRISSWMSRLSSNYSELFDSIS